MGRVDITCEVSIMPSYVSMPREDHLKRVYYMFDDHKLHHNLRLVIEPTYLYIKKEGFPNNN